MKTNMDYETLHNSMTVQDAIRVLKETNCYGTMDIAKNVILKALDEQTKEHTEEHTETYECDTEHIIKTTIKEYLDKDYDDVTELLLALNKDLCERIRKEC